MKLKNIFRTILPIFACSAMLVACEGEDDGLGNTTPIKPDGENHGLVDLTDDMFNTKVFDLKADPDMKKFLGDRPVFIDFGAEWCGNCHKMHPIVESVANKYGKKMDFFYADQDLCGQVHERFSKHFGRGVLPMPCYITIDKDGNISELYEGLMTEAGMSELVEKIVGAPEPETPTDNRGLVNLTTEMFNSEVFNLDSDADLKSFLGDRPVFIDFGAEWCGNCHKMHPIVEAVAQEYGDRARFYYADQDVCGPVHERFSKHFGLGVLPMPCYITITKDGKISELYQGLMSKEGMAKLIEDVLK